MLATASVTIGFDDPWTDPSDAAFEFDELQPSIMNRMSDKILNWLNLTER